jgi:hypothetical protein
MMSRTKWVSNAADYQVDRDALVRIRVAAEIRYNITKLIRFTNIKTFQVPGGLLSLPSVSSRISHLRIWSPKKLADPRNSQDQPLLQIFQTYVISA